MKSLNLSVIEVFDMSNLHMPVCSRLLYMWIREIKRSTSFESFSPEKDCRDCMHLRFVACMSSSPVQSFFEYSGLFGLWLCAFKVIHYFLGKIAILFPNFSLLIVINFAALKHSIMQLQCTSSPLKTLQIFFVNLAILMWKLISEHKTWSLKLNQPERYISWEY